MSKEKILGRVLKGYDPKRDIAAVEQTGYVDLKAANASSSIPAVDGIDEERYNGIDDPRSIGTRPSDQFEAMQANKSIAGYKSPESSAENAE